MSETETTQPLPNTYNPIVSVSGLTPGMVVAASGTSNHVVAADASDVSTAFATGLLLGPAPTEAGSRSNVRYAGVVSLPAADWVLATEEGTVLTPGVPYYVSDSAPGKITKTAPSAEGDVPEQVGVALSTVSIMVQIGGEGIVGPPGPPASITTEHVTTVADAVVIDPAVDVSFVTAGGDQDGPATGTMADGTSDGQNKIVRYESALPGNTLRVTPTNFADGTRVTLPDTGGGAHFTWNDTTGKWELVATYGGVVS